MSRLGNGQRFVEQMEKGVEILGRETGILEYTEDDNIVENGECEPAVFTFRRLDAQPGGEIHDRRVDDEGDIQRIQPTVENVRRQNEPRDAEALIGDSEETGERYNKE